MSCIAYLFEREIARSVIWNGVDCPKGLSLVYNEGAYNLIISHVLLLCKWNKITREDHLRVPPT